MSDVDLLCEAGYLPPTAILTLLPSFKYETSRLVWDAIFGLLGSIRFLLRNKPEEKTFDAMILGMFFLKSIKSSGEW